MNSYNKINYNNFLKVLKLVFEDINIRHDENFHFILFINYSIYKDKYMENITYSRDIVLLAALKTFIEENTFLISKIDNDTLLFCKDKFKCIMTSKSNNINTLYNNLKYLNSEYHRIVDIMENTFKSISEELFVLEKDKSLFVDDEIEILTKKCNEDIEKSFYSIHLYLCVKFILCNLSSIKISPKIDKDLVIQRNIKYLYYLFDGKNYPSDTEFLIHFHKFLLEYKDKFNTYLYNYCKYNNLLDENNEIKFIVVEDFLINDFFEKVCFDKNIKDYFDGCFIQMNGVKNPKKTLNSYIKYFKKKSLSKVQLIV